MSRGPGRVQRRLVELLGEAGHSSAELIAALLPQAAPNAARKAAVHRALAALKRRGAVVQAADRGWWRADVWRQEEDRRLRVADAERRAADTARRQADERRRKAELSPLPWDAAQRDRLVKFLGMLGSAHGGEILEAARQADRLRQRVGRSWAELIVPAATASVTPFAPGNAYPAAAPARGTGMKIPLLILAADLAQWLIAEAKAQRFWVGLNPFVDAVSKLPHRVKLGYAPAPDDPAVARLHKTYHRCELMLQLHIAEFAERAGCRERLAELIGPLAEPEPVPQPRHRKPMF